jgi:(2Fe-2S) ferredoxin
VVVYPEGIWYRVRSEADVKEIMERHIVNGEPVKELMMPDQAPPPLLSPLKSRA